MHPNSTILQSGYNSSYDAYPVENCRVELKNQPLWQQFHRLDNEMVVTKTGRRMFPAIHVTIDDMDPQASYCVYLELALVAPCRYKYASSVGWSPAGNEEVQSPHRLYMHPESPQTGQYWMSQFVSFGRVKLTNSATPAQGNLVLSSMHKYQPKILIVKTCEPQSMAWAPTKTVCFAETQFIAVTAYQNERITKLKINHNPFAKGFRENGKSGTNKRKSSGDKDEREVKKNRSEPKEMKAAKEQQVVNAPGGFPMQNHPFYGYYPYYMYNPVWPSPMYYSYPVWNNNQVGITREEPVAVKKLTDFSIRAITGLS